MTTIIQALQSIVGKAEFWKQLPSNNSSYTSYTWDYGAMIEYFFACLILCIVVGSIFKFIMKLVSR